MNKGTLVILAAHGAGDGSPANLRVQAITDSVAHARRDLRVVAAFNMGTPRFADVLALHGANSAVVLPLMTSDGYFANHRLREQLTGDPAANDRTLTMLSPVGVRPEAVALLVRRVGEALLQARLASEETHIVVIGHGTRRSPKSGAATDALAESLRAAYPLADVRSAFLDQEPLLEVVSPSFTRAHIIAVPLLIGGGGHALSDVPSRLGLDEHKSDDRLFQRRADGRDVLIMAPLGEDGDFASLVLNMIDAALPRAEFTLGTRTSRLARWQADAAAKALASIGARPVRVDINTDGDRDLRKPLEEFATDGPFTDALESELLTGRIDIAVHSLKDLPSRLVAGTRIAAVLPRWSPLEVLVSHAHTTLEQLPHGAIVGTCSQRRALQLRRVRPDLQTLPIRGTVEERVRRVRTGEFAATILAHAGLARLGMEDNISQFLPIEDFVPEAGQGAIALQVRDDDDRLISLCSALDHAVTHYAVSAERRFSQLVHESTGFIAAVVVTVQDGLRLVGRAMSSDGEVCIDVTEHGTSTEGVAVAAALRVQAQLAAGKKVLT